MVTPRLATQGLTKRFGTCTSVDEVSLEFAPGEIHAVLGENGAGKSTLMRLLFGLHAPTSGAVLLNDEPVHFKSSLDAIARGLGMVQQHFTLVETLSVIDNIMLGAEVCGKLGRLNRPAAIARMEKRVPSAALALPWLAKVSELSVGQKQRVEILKLLFREARVLVLDEPTAVLTPAECEDLFTVLRQLKNEGRSVILITHKIGEVKRVCDTYAVLRAGRLVARGRVADTPAEAIVESMIGRRLPAFDLPRPAVRENLLLNIISLSTGSADRGRLRDVSLSVRAGEIVGIAGVEGSGQSALVDAIMGLSEFSGGLELCGQSVTNADAADVRRRGVSLVPEDRLHQALWLDETCYHNMVIGCEDRFVRNFMLREGALRETTAKWARDFDVRGPSLQSPVGELSGGNQQKIVFAREVTGRAPKLLICHQPTRGVDLGAIDLIHRRLMKLRNEGVGQLILSSELDELQKICDRIYVLFEGRIVTELPRARFSLQTMGQAMTGTLSEEPAHV